MRTIRQPHDIVMSILGKHQLAEGLPYRMYTSVVQAEHEDGLLLYNLLNKSIVLLSNEEKAFLQVPHQGFDPILEELANLWFIVPKDLDDCDLADSVHGVMKALDNEDKGINSYTIFTTTNCNARCFYCFEAGTKRQSMSNQTAHDVAKFIAKHHKGKVTLKWFGGEPLLNIKAIDIICQDLKDEGVDYISRMTSNGYLFDDEIISKAIAEWCLKSVQITLDGTEDNYNRRKAYVNPDTNPYKRVLANIKALLDAQISVSVRLNMDSSNVEDIKNLCEELHTAFGPQRGLSVYIASVYEDVGDDPVHYSDEVRLWIEELADDLNDELCKKGLNKPQKLPEKLKLSQCMADSSVFTTVLPDGHLGRCEHYTDSEFYGSIYEEETDSSVLTKWTEKYRSKERCKDCIFYAECSFLVSCPENKDKCNQEKISLRMRRYEKALINSYGSE